MKKLWFKLVERDIYYYKSKDENNKHQGMHNLSGVYLEEESQVKIENKNFFSFSIVYPKKIRRYYCDDEKEYNNWINNLKNVTGYANLTDIFEVKVRLYLFRIKSETESSDLCVLEYTKRQEEKWL